MLQMGFLAVLCLLLQLEPQATGGLPGRVRNLPGPRPPVDQALGPRDKDAKRASKGVSRDNRYLYSVLTFMALITGVSMFYLSNVSLKEMFVT